MKYVEHLPAQGIEPVLHDIWHPAFESTDVVHFFSCIGGSVQFCHYVHGRGIPLVITSSLWITEATAHLYPIDEIRAQLALADVVVPNSSSEAATLARVLGLPLDRFMPVMNGVDARFTAAHDPGPFRTLLGLEGPFALNVGNVEPRKNQLNLVRAARTMDLPVVVIGHVRDNAYAEAVFAEGGDRLRYMGPLAHEDALLASAYAACAVFVLPSALETPGLAALEAAAAGAPLLITAEGSTRDYFGSMAHYVDHTDVADIRRGIEAALAAGSDLRLRAHVAEHFAWDKVAAELRLVYLTAIERRDRRLGRK
jgi:glycosyltransferase involved in cell wall biosynthesis